MITITQVKPLSNYCLHLQFNNMEEKIFDVKPYLSKGIFTELKNLDYFNTVHLNLDSISWKNGQDFSPDTLYLQSITMQKAN